MKKIILFILISILLISCKNNGNKEILDEVSIDEMTTILETTLIEETSLEETSIVEETTNIEETSNLLAEDDKIKSVLSRLKNELEDKNFESIKVTKEDSDIVEEEAASPSTTKIVGQLMIKDTDKNSKSIEILPIPTVVMYKDVYPELYEYKYVETTTKQRETTTKAIQVAQTVQGSSSATTTKKKEEKSNLKKYTITVGALKFVFNQVNGYAITQPSSNALRYQSVDTATVIDCISINPSSSTVYLRNAYKAAVNLHGEGVVVVEQANNKNVDSIKIYTFEQKLNGNTIKSIPIAAFAEVDSKHGIQINNTSGTEPGGVFITNITKALNIEGN